MEIRADPDDFMSIYNMLQKDKPLLNKICETIEHLKSNDMVGKRLKREQIPKYYLKKHDANVVYKVDLPGYWRLIYGIISIHGEKKVILMELFDHAKYDKRFGY